MRKLFLALVILFCSCARAPLKDAGEAMRLDPGFAGRETLSDSLPLEDFQKALERTLKAWDNTKIQDPMRFGAVTIPKKEYRAALERLRKEAVSKENLLSFLRERFDFYEVYGTKDDGWGAAFATGYYDPLLKGSRRRQGAFTVPLYALPPDLVRVDFNAFAAGRPELEPVRRAFVEQKARDAILRGRLVDGDEGKRVVPYYERKEIDGDGRPLAGKNLELAWVDPIDAFYLHIQGSGIVEFPGGGRLHVGYAGQNGFTYEAIGKFLTDKIPLAEMTMQKIRAHLRSLTPEARNEILFKNPSYVFFQKLPGASLTYSGAEVTPGRTIASDQLFFPKGALAYLDIEIPQFKDAETAEISSWEKSPRLVFDQDTGGAIRGGGRLDLYMGSDSLAAQRAGVMKRVGRLWYLVPKNSFLEELRRADTISAP